MYVVPVDNSPNHTFRITIPVDGENKTFRMKLVYNSVGKYWMLTIMDISGKVILSNVNLVCTCGTVSMNILDFVKYLRIGGLSVVDDGAFTFSMPNDKQLGNRYKLVWGDTPS